MTDREVSTRTRQVRNRLRKQTEKLEEKVQRDIALIYKPVDEWDWEELSKGRPRGEDGKFSGRPPTWITPAIQAEAQRRMRAFTEAELMTHARDAIKVLTDLMKNDEIDDFGKSVVPAAVKYQSATYIVNHVIGLPKARHEISTHNPLEELMGGILVNPDGEPSHQIIEGAMYETDDEMNGEGDDDR